MDYARQQRDPTRHLIGFVTVVLLHAVIVYALMTGLARKAVEVIKQPITAVIIPEVKPPPPPPPPPPKIVQAPPKVQAPPPPTYVPPPDVPPPTPPVEAPVITAVAPTPPPEPYVIAPPPPPVEAPPAPPAAPAKPAMRAAAKVCSVREEIGFPRQAIKQGIQKGRVLARLNIDERGNVLEVSIVSADPPRHFDRAVIDGLSQWKCQAEGARYVAEVEVNFKLD